LSFFDFEFVGPPSPGNLVQTKIERRERTDDVLRHVEEEIVLLCMHEQRERSDINMLLLRAWLS